MSAAHERPERTHAGLTQVPSGARLGGRRSLIAGLVLLGVGLVAGSYVVSLYNYLLFHSFVEIFTAVVGLTLLITVLRLFSLTGNGYLTFLGIGYGWAAFIDIVHTLAYKGMGVFPGATSNLPTQLWISARTLEAACILLAPIFLTRRLRPAVAAVSVGAAVALLLTMVFSGVFPTCYVEGQGLTPFKRIAEYVISLGLLTAVAIVWKQRARFDRFTRNALTATFLLTACAEIAFTFYVNVYGLSNYVGHVFKLLAYSVLLVLALRNMLWRPVNAMQALIPMCSRCKAVRDEDHVWRPLEDYLGAHTGTQVTHGLCPTCLAELYPELAPKLPQRPPGDAGPRGGAAPPGDAGPASGPAAGS